MKPALMLSLALWAALQASARADPPSPTPPAAKASSAPPAGARPPLAPPPLTPAAVNGASFASPRSPPATEEARKAPDPLTLKAEILLDRQNFSPGAIDGVGGENYHHALEAFAQARGLPVRPDLSKPVFDALADRQGPVIAAYVVTPADVAGPFDPDVGENFVRMSKMKSIGYGSPKEALAERFHMDESLLEALNPGADFGRAGLRILVADPHPQPLPEVSSILVDKKNARVLALGGDGKPVAALPATVGSTERPSPKGRFKVVGVAQNPDYTYDPRKLTWGPRRHGKLHIPPGPNGPVGVVWIALSAHDYGIHGTPAPRLIGKTASHGCVRLTNWDAEALSRAVKPGVPVTFAQ